MIAKDFFTAKDFRRIGTKILRDHRFNQLFPLQLGLIALFGRDNSKKRAAPRPRGAEARWEAWSAGAQAQRDGGEAWSAGAEARGLSPDGRNAGRTGGGGAWGDAGR